jgi:hypothetical protein
MLGELLFEKPAMILPDFLTHDADDEIRLTGHRQQARSRLTSETLYGEGAIAIRIRSCLLPLPNK